MNIFVVRKHFYQLTESSEVSDVVTFTDNKPLRFYILVIKEYQVNIPKQVLRRVSNVILLVMSTVPT